MLVEMHAHVIYGVDDGPETPEEMRHLMEAAARTGVTHLFCTSHARAGFQRALYEERLAEAKAFVREKGLALTLYPGNEILYGPDTLALLREGKVLPLGDSRTVLTEFMPGASAAFVAQAVRALRQEGWQPIIAHAERCPALCRGSALRRLREETGVRVQVNAASIYEEETGFFFKRRVRKLLRKGLADHVSSDAHDLLHRPFCLPYAHHWLGGHLSPAQADAMCGGNMAAEIKID